MRFKFRYMIKQLAFPYIQETLNKAFSQRCLFYTNVFLSFSMSGAGDFVEQQYEITTGEERKYNFNRTRNMSLYGCSAGVLTHFWYIFLDNAIPGGTLNVVMKKLILDQLLCSPLLIFNMFVIVGILEKQTSREIISEIKTKSMNLYITEWIIWPPAQFLNFYLIPSKFRILYDNAISFGYDIYYSSIKYR